MKRMCCLVILLLSSLAQMGQTADIEPYRQILELGKGTISSFAWQSDRIIAGGSRGLWLYTSEFVQLGFAELPDVQQVAWSETSLAAAQADGTLSLWTVSSEITRRKTLRHAGSPINALAWSGNLLAAAVDDDSVEIWNTDGQLLQTFPGDFISLAWNGEQLAMGGENGIIALTDGTTLQQTGAVTALAWHENTLVNGSPDGALTFWDTTTHTLLAVRHDHTARINSLVWQGSRLASVSGENFEGSKLVLWDTMTPSMIVGGTADMLQAAWQEERVAVLSADHLIRTWNAGTGAALSTLQGHIGSVDTIAWSPDGHEIASASSDGLVRIWHADTGTIIASLIGHTRGINTIVWSPDGEMLASAGWDNTVRVWMRRTGKTRTVFRGHSRRVWDLAWSSDGKTLASTSRDFTVQVWNVYTGETRHILRGAESDLQSVVWSPDGQQIAASTDDGKVFVWDAASGQLVHLLEGHRYYVWSLAWRPDGKQLISSSWHDGVMRVWDAESWEKTATLNSTAVLAVAWNPAGTKLASSSDDGSIRLWDMRGEKVLRVINAHHAPIHSLEWRPDGAALASASEDGTIRLWSN